MSAWGGLALGALSLPLLGDRGARPPAHWAWAISILVAALAFAIAYVRNSVTLARIFLREARRRRAASGEVGPAS